jgi:LysR family positive regulator for ilvC
MDHDSLKIFLHLTETLHFGKTSRECFITPSGLSRVIQRLEKETGKELFIRDRRSVSITPAGKLFREYAVEALDRWKIFKESADKNEDLHGELSIYCSVTASYGILHDILNRFRASYPLVHIRLKTGEEAKALQMLQDRLTDISIAAKPDLLPAGVIFIESTTTPLLIIAPECRCSVSDELKKNPESWWDLPLILPEHGLARKRMEELFRKNKKKLSIYAEISGNEAIIAMVSLGCGTGVVPGLVLDQSPLKKEVHVLNVKPVLKPYQVGFCINTSRHVPMVVQAFWEVCKNSQP